MTTAPYWSEYWFSHTAMISIRILYHSFLLIPACRLSSLATLETDSTKWSSGVSFKVLSQSATDWWSVCSILMEIVNS